MGKNATQEQLCPLARRLGEKQCRWRLFDDLALVHEDHGVGDLAGEAHLVGDDDHRHPLLRELDHDVEHFLDHLGVEGRGRLVEQHDLRAHAERTGDRDPLLLATRELRRVFVRLLGNAHPLEVVAGQVFGLLLAEAAAAHRRQSEVAQHRQMREEIELLEDHADLGADLGDVSGVVVELGAVDGDPAGIVLFEPVDAADQRRLARARRAADDHAFAERHLEVDILEGLERAEELGYTFEPNDRLRHRRLSPLFGGQANGCEGAGKGARAATGCSTCRPTRGSMPMADALDLNGLDPALAREVADALETTPELLPLMPAILQDLPDLGGGCTGPVLEALQRLGLQRGARVLDLGCGRGELAIALARIFGTEVTGIDAFPPFVAAARAAALAAGVDCRFLEGDLRRAVETARDYDAVLLVSVGPVFGDHARTIAAVRRTVRAGGLIVIADAHLDGPPPPGEVWKAYADRATTERRLMSAGDRLVLARPLKAEQRDWNAHAMAAIRRRTAELAIRHPELAGALAAYAARQEEEFACLETGPAVSMLRVLEKADSEPVRDVVERPRPLA